MKLTVKPYCIIYIWIVFIFFCISCNQKKLEILSISEATQMELEEDKKHLIILTSKQQDSEMYLSPLYEEKINEIIQTDYIISCWFWEDVSQCKIKKYAMEYASMRELYNHIQEDLLESNCSPQYVIFNKQFVPQSFYCYVNRHNVNEFYHWLTGARESFTEENKPENNTFKNEYSNFLVK